MKKKQLTKEVAEALLRNEKIGLSGCWSEKSGKTYDATVALEDDGKQTLFRLEFGAKLAG